MTRNYDFKWWHVPLGLIALGGVVSILRGDPSPAVVGARQRLIYRDWDIDLESKPGLGVVWKASYRYGPGDRSGLAPNMFAAEAEAKAFIDEEESADW